MPPLAPRGMPRADRAYEKSAVQQRRELLAKVLEIAIEISATGDLILGIASTRSMRVSSPRHPWRRGRGAGVLLARRRNK